MLKFKEFLQKEERSNPDLNPKISINQRIKDYLDKSIMLSSVKDTKNAFVSFTSLEKLGLNPKSKYSTPLGIYSYPLDYVYDEIGDNLHPEELPYVGDAPFANLFSVEGSIIDLKNMTKIEFDKWVEILKRKYLDLVNKNLSIAVDTAKVNTPGGWFWNLTRLISSNPVNWNTVFQSIGIDGCVDNGDSIIHINEPTQAVFFNTRCLKHIQRWDNKTIVSSLPLNLKTVSDITNSLKNGSITQKQADDAYIFLLSKNLKLLNQIPNPSEAVKLAAVGEDGLAIRLILNPSEAVKLAAVGEDGSAIQYIKNPSEAVQLAAVKENGYAIKHIQNPSEAVQLAVTQKNSLAIEFIQNPTEKVQLAIVQKDGSAIQYIQNPSEKIQLAAVENKGFAIGFIKNPSEAVQLVATQKYGSAIKYIQNPSEAVQLAAVKDNGFAIQYIQNPSEAVQLAAVKGIAYAIRHIKNPTEKVQLAAVKEDAYAIRHIENPTEAVQLAAVEEHGSAIQYIKNPTPAVKKLAGVE